MDNQSVLLLLTDLEDLNDLSTVQQREQGSKSKSAVTCPKFVKLYNDGMGSVNLMDQRTASYQLHRKFFVRFYLRIFFDLMDIACDKSYIVTHIRNPDKLTLLDFNIVVAINLIQWHQG